MSFFQCWSIFQYS